MHKKLVNCDTHIDDLVNSIKSSIKIFPSCGLMKPHNKGIYDEVLEEASQLKSSNPDLDLTDRYYIAYYSVKKKKKLKK